MFGIKILIPLFFIACGVLLAVPVVTRAGADATDLARKFVAAHEAINQYWWAPAVALGVAQPDVARRHGHLPAGAGGDVAARAAAARRLKAVARRRPAADRAVVAAVARARTVRTVSPHPIVLPWLVVS